jgi:hypothetical protein
MATPKRSSKANARHSAGPATDAFPEPDRFPDRETDELARPSDRDQREADLFRLRSSALFREAATALDRIETKHDLSMESRIALRQALAQHASDFLATGGAAEPDLPSKPPERWSRREGRKENPVAFIRRVYAPWLNRGFTRSHLLALDRSLYSALGVWLHRHPDVEFPELITPAEDLRDILARRVQSDK